MHKLLKITSIAIIILVAFAFNRTLDFLQTLGISKEEANDYVWYSFEDGSFSYPYSDDYKSLNASVRVTLVNEIGTFAKAYSRTDDFKKRYNDYRLNQKPSEPDPPQTTQEMKNQYKKDLQKSIDDLEQNMVNASGEVKTALESALKTMKDQLVQIDDPDNPMFSKEVEDARQQYYQGQQQQYQDALNQWKEDYPEDPVKMIKKRLSYFIDQAGTIDFSAKVSKNEYGNYVFINPDNENKPSDWKMLYRAGKESTDAASQFARQWLSELP
jgi:hypothetical protein